MTNPRILILDIETKPAVAYIWRMFKENISVDQLISPGGILCVGAKWYGEKGDLFFSDWEHGQEGMIREVHRLLTEADAVITFNGDKFDLPKLMGQFLINGLTPPPPPTSIDILKTVKKLGLQSNRLMFVGPYLQVGKKVEHEGFTLWSKVINGDERARRRMQRYCTQDVQLTEKVYRKIRPYIRDHPHMGLERKAETCGACGSTHVQKRGNRRTKHFLIQNLQCQSCGSWSSGKRTKIG